MQWRSTFSLPWPMYSLVATLNCVTASPGEGANSR